MSIPSHALAATVGWAGQPRRLWPVALLALALVALPGCGEGEVTQTGPVREDPDIPEQSGFGPPVSEPLAISSTFGPRWKYSDSRDDFHRGIDYYGDLGDPILAIADGEVTGVFPDGSVEFPNGGNTLIVRHELAEPFTYHGTTITRIYAVNLHLDSFAVSLGEAVTAGQTIGAMGQSGDTVFTHLHFEIRVQTTCSLEYQLNNPASGCAGYGFDPHVHPYVFVGGENDDMVLGLEQSGGSPFTVDYETGRGDLDLNVVRTDLGELNFNRRTGIDASSTAALDDFDYGWMVLVPDVFVSSSEIKHYTFEFPEKPKYIELVDLHGVGIRREF